MLELLTDPNAWAAFATLTALELVLGIDNIIFISILVDRLRSPDVTQLRRPVCGKNDQRDARASRLDYRGIEIRGGGA